MCETTLVSNYSPPSISFKGLFQSRHKPYDFNSMEIILQLYMLGDVIMKFEGGSFSIRIIFRHICEHLTLNGVSFYHSD